MAFRINSNIAALNALRHLHDTEEALSTNLERLSSGRKLNHASDGPAAMVISEQMKTQIESLDQSIRNSEISMSMLQTTEGALSEVSNILIDMRQLAVHAANEGTNDPKMLQADQNEIENLLSTLGNISRNTQFGTRTLLDGSNSATAVAVGNGLEFVRATETAKSSPAEGYKVDITQVATRAQKIGLTPLSVENIGDGLFVLVSEGGRNAELDTRRGQLKDDIDNILKSHSENPERFPAEKMSADIRGMIVYHLQKTIDENGLNVDIFEGPGGIFQIRHREYGDEPSFSVTSNIAGILSQEANMAEFSNPGMDVAGTIANATARGDGQFLTAMEGTPAQGIKIQFDRDIQLREVPVFEEQTVPVFDENGNEKGTEVVQVRVGTEFVQETQEEVVGSPENPKIEGYVHLSQQTKKVNLGPIQGNEAGISLKDVRTSKLSQGIKNESQLRSLSDIDLTDLQSAKDSSELIDHAIDEISRYRAKIGAFQKNTVERNMNTLKVAAETATQGESVIRDTDMAAEMSKLTSDQILLSASQSMLSQANQLPRNVLQLLESE